MAYTTHRLSAVILGIALIAVTMSGCGDKKADKSYDVFDSSYESLSAGVLSNPDSGSNKEDSSRSFPKDKLATIDKTKFSEIAASYGEIQDVSEEFGFDALAVHSDNEMNYIYMMLQNDAAAKSMLFGGAGSINQNVTVVKAGDNYDYYEEKSDSNESPENSFFGYYLRVDNMLLLVTGPANDSNSVRSKAKSFFQKFGYDK